MTSSLLDHKVALMCSWSAGAGKVFTYTGVPQDASKTLAADAWQKSTFELLDAKGGGKATTAKAAGSNVDNVAEAVEVARNFAVLKLI